MIISPRLLISLRFCSCYPLPSWKTLPTSRVTSSKKHSWWSSGCRPPRYRSRHCQGQEPLQHYGQRSFAHSQPAPQPASFQNDGQLLAQPQPGPGGRAHTPQALHQHLGTLGVKANNEKKGSPGLPCCPRSPSSARISLAVAKDVPSSRPEPEEKEASLLILPPSS
uniref:IQ motif and SEC7 domain-containing protein 3-like n=1 Tax=Callithrix jacchus TaxID=9483 RepID=UPI0023DD56B0|nr:IQ motif and SEC7 domain-containing protein 3-like [Callithrix jacchus]